MKDKKNFDLQKIPTLKIDIYQPDQAKQSNELEKKLGLTMPPVPTDLSKKDVIKILEGMKDTIKGSATDLRTLELIHILDFALKDYAKCHNCKGSGHIIDYHKPPQNYTPKVSPKGVKYFLINCLACNGSGKVLSVHCASCGENTPVMPDQRHLDYCHKCETRLVRSGVIL